MPKTEAAVLRAVVIQMVFSLSDWDDYQKWVRVVARHTEGIMPDQGGHLEPLLKQLKIF